MEAHLNAPPPPLTPLHTLSPLSSPHAQSPFLFAVFHNDTYPEGKPDMSINAPLHNRNIGSDFGNKDWNMYHGTTVPGFPQHPHRGFETITVSHEGLVDHHDSMGCQGRFGNGDTQWMTAGAGISHSEMVRGYMTIMYMDHHIYTYIHDAGWSSYDHRDSLSLSPPFSSHVAAIPLLVSVPDASL